jgi:uncharacterized protein
MDTRAKIKAALPEAMKAKDEVRTGTLRLILAALKDKDIEFRGSGKGEQIEEPAVLSLLQGMIKQRKESLDMYRKAARADLAEREEAEIRIIESYLPKQMGDAEAEVAAVIEKIIKETGAKDVKDMGKVMGALKSGYAGQLDMGKASGLIKQKLAG